MRRDQRRLTWRIINFLAAVFLIVALLAIAAIAGVVLLTRYLP